MAHEHIYWDQAPVLVQFGLLEAGTLPVTAIDCAWKALDPGLPSNTLPKNVRLDSDSRKLDACWQAC